MKVQFLQYRYDTERGLEGPAGRIALRRGDAQLLQLLQLLLEADDRTVSKDAIITAVWNGRDVTDDSIFQATRRLRARLCLGPGRAVGRGD